MRQSDEGPGLMVTGHRTNWLDALLHPGCILRREVFCKADCVCCNSQITVQVAEAIELGAIKT